MKRARSIVLSGVLAGSAFAFVSSEASAQAVPPSAPRDSGFEIASNITMALGVATVTFMPRVYYNDPEATFGWKSRWHISQLAPSLALTSITLLIDGPIKGAIESTRPGCTLDETNVHFPDSGCESFGGPSTHSFAAASAAGAGIGIWVADTFVHSNSEVHAGSIIGNIAVPVVATVLTSVFRGISSEDTLPLENGGQIGAGVLVGVPIGFLTGIAYGVLQEPNCGYGDNLICW